LYGRLHDDLFVGLKSKKVSFAVLHSIIVSVC
jgi:hypothetical protein